MLQLQPAHPPHAISAYARNGAALNRGVVRVGRQVNLSKHDLFHIVATPVKAVELQDCNSRPQFLYPSVGKIVIDGIRFHDGHFRCRRPHYAAPERLSQNTHFRLHHDTLTKACKSAPTKHQTLADASSPHLSLNRRFAA